MHKYFRASAWILGACTIVIAVICAHFGDNIRGYYKFKSLCETEAGIQVFHPLQRGVGWTAKRNYGHLVIANMKQVAFGRYVDANGTLRDIRYRTGPIGAEASYDIVSADITKPVVYSLTMFTEAVPETHRTHRSGYEVREIATGRLMVRWTQVGYSTFDQDHTLLAAPSGQVCHSWHDFDNPENQAKYFAN